TAGVSSEVGLVDADLLDTGNNIGSDFLILTGLTTVIGGTGGSGDGDGETLTFGPVQAVCDSDDSIVDIRVALLCFVDAHFGAGGNPCGLEVELLQRPEGGSTDETIYQRRIDYKYENPDQGSSTASADLPFNPPPRKPGAGTWEYRVRLTIDIAHADNDLEIQPTDVRLTALVFN
ncbi:MAG: hypothetical protein ACRD3A_02805, partial [Terriglobales bacterium]